ncbi:putative heavy metal-associated domain, HMA, heavy metal-associated domain superfamily [Helianthus anomalus]
MTNTFGILGFHNCDGCARKVRSALRTIGVEMVQLDRETGNVTVSSAESSEVIKYALQRELKKSVVVLSRDLVPTNRATNSSVSRHVPANQTFDLQGLGQEVARMAQVYGGVEITTSNTMKINFFHGESTRVVRTETRGNIDVQSFRERHSRHHGESRSRETQVVVSQNHRGSISGVNPEKHRHHRHHGEPQNREARLEYHGNSGDHTHRHHHRHHGESHNREPRQEHGGHSGGDHTQRHHHHRHHGESHNHRHH